MLRRMCKAKIHRATVTSAVVEYEGSIEIDQTLIDAAGILVNEMVLVANMNNGNRFETYVIPGKRDSGVIGLKGAAALLGKPGDQIIVMSEALVAPEELPGFKPIFVNVDKKNKITSIK